MVLKNERGQTVVEYILLFAVVTSLVLTFYRSAIFQKLFGDNGSLGIAIKKQSEFGYRHAFLYGRIDESPTPVSSAAQHQSYYNQTKGETRFFGPREKYP